MAGFTGFSFGGASTGTGSGFTGFSLGGSGALSPEQLASLQAASQTKHTSTLLGEIEGAPGSIFKGTKSVLGTALNYISRPAEAVDTALTQGALAGDHWNRKTFSAMGSGFWKGLSGRSHDTFSDYIRAEFPKFAAHHKTLTAIGGFAGTLATDPTLPLIIGAQAIPGVNVSVDEAEAARLASIMGTADDNATNLAHADAALKAMGDATAAGSTKFSARTTLAQLLKAKAAGADIPEADIIATEEGARVEAAQYTRKALQLQYAIPFSGGKSIPLSPVMLGGQRVAPTLPSLRGIADAGVPFASKTANVMGQMFKHGFDSPLYDKVALATKTKAKELFHHNIIRSVATQMGPLFKKLSEAEQEKALNYGETRHGIVRVGGGKRVLNQGIVDRAVAHGELSADQGAYLTQWHTHMESMREQEVAQGLTHPPIGDIVYVPHHFKREGGIASTNDIAGTHGFTKERQNKTLREIKAAEKDNPKRLNLVTQPEQIMARRVEQSADAMATQTFRRVLSRMVGVADRIPDVEARNKALQEVRALMKGQRDLPTLKPGGLHGIKTSLGIKYAKLLKGETDRILTKHGRTVSELDRRIALHQELLHSPSEYTPTYSEAMSLSRKSFHDRIPHYEGPHKIRAQMIHGAMRELGTLKAKLGKIPVRRGGSQADIKAIGDRINILRTRVAKLNSKVVEPIDFTPSRGARETWRGNVKEQLANVNRALSHDYNVLRGGYKVGHNVDHNRAIGNLEARRAVVQKKAEADLKVAAEKLKGKKAVEREKIDKQFERDAKSFEVKQAAIDTARKQYGKMKTNPDIPAGYRKWESTKIGGTHYHFPDEVHTAMTRMEQVANNPDLDRQLSVLWRKMMSTWKIGVTSVNPGYRVRNTASDIWNMYIGGVPMARIAEYGKKAAQLQRLAHQAGEKLAADNVELTRSEANALNALNEMQLRGILSGLFQGDVQQVAHMFKSGLKARTYLKGANPVALGKAYVKATSDWNRHAENWGRITHYLYRRDYQGLSAGDAAAWVKKAHFDYEELTPFEQKHMKAIFPFYTWTRKDLPYQMSQIASRPGKYATFPKVVQSSNELAGGQPDQQPGLEPQWMKDQYMFRVPGGAYMQPAIGVTDWQAVDHPIQEVLSQLNPVAKVGDALLTGNNPDTGQPIVGSHQRNPVSGIGADLLSAIPGSNVGGTAREVNGQEKMGPGANPWYTYLAQQTPLTNLLINSMSNIKGAQRGSGLYAPASYLSGLSLYNRDATGEQTAAQLDFANHMKTVIRSMRDTGLIAPSKAKKNSAYQMQLNQLIAGGS